MVCKMDNEEKTKVSVSILGSNDPIAILYSDSESGYEIRIRNEGYRNIGFPAEQGGLTVLNTLVGGVIKYLRVHANLMDPIDPKKIIEFKGDEPES